MGGGKKIQNRESSSGKRAACDRLGRMEVKRDLRRYTRGTSEGAWCVISVLTEAEGSRKSDSTSVLGSKYH